jgi:hypothetical protein
VFEFLKNILAGDRAAHQHSESKHSAHVSDPDEILLASIKAYRQSMFEAAESETAANQRRSGGDRQKIERAERFLGESGLAHGLAMFMTTIWLMRNTAEGASESRPVAGKCGIQLTGGGRADRSIEWIEFLYGKHRYRVENRPNELPSSDASSDYRYGQGIIYCDGVEVLRIETKQHYKDEYFLWEYRCVSLFAKGDWIPEIVELFTKLEIEDRQLIPKSTAEFEKKLADRITE